MKKYFYSCGISTISKISTFALAVIIVLSIGFFSACEEKDKENITNDKVTNLQFTNCKYDKSDSNDSIQETIQLEFVGNTLNVFHQNLYVPCDYDTIYIKPTITNNTLTILEQGNNGFVNCVCPVDLSYCINNIDTNAISLIIINWDTVYNNLKK